jgi:hypothetical protein
MDNTGIGKAFGGLVGAALAAAGGIHLGMAAASVVIPGVGPVVAIGVAAAALLGTAGALGGASGGKFLEDLLNEGLPNDELFLYEDALRKGCTVLILQARDENQVDACRQVMIEAGAKDLNSAREDWWLGVRSAEEQRYTPDWGDFEMDEVCYRMGFEAALRTSLRGKNYSTALNFLQKYHSVAVCNHAAFRHGYERGQAYDHALQTTTSGRYSDI